MRTHILAAVFVRSAAAQQRGEQQQRQPSFQFTTPLYYIGA